jgi:hypothetical protein
MKKEKLFISFSGGETSAYMLWWLLKNKSAEYEIIVLFANTGNENEETLEFVKRCGELFNVEIIWVEAVPTWTIVFNGKKVRTTCFRTFQMLRKYEIKRGRRPILPNSPTTFKQVTFETASRNGEPFEKVIQRYGIPNKKYLHCTRELKLRPMTKYLRSIGWKAGSYHTAIGIRIDEIDRIQSDWREKKLYYPLIKDRPMSKPKINFFWSQMPFRLELKGYEGNCKDCYKKSQNKLLTIALENPSMFDFSIRYSRYRSYQQRKGKSRVELNMAVNFFRDNMTPQELIELAQTKTFTKSHNDADVYDFEGVKDEYNSCSESCEVEW